jgi:hypothetical protein
MGQARRRAVAITMRLPIVVFTEAFLSTFVLCTQQSFSVSLRFPRRGTSYVVSKLAVPRSYLKANCPVSGVPVQLGVVNGDCGDANPVVVFVYTAIFGVKALEANHRTKRLPLTSLRRVDDFVSPAGGIIVFVGANLPVESAVYSITVTP